jgi:hypothetical protein
MTFRLTIRCDNAAFFDEERPDAGRELSDLLSELSVRVQDAEPGDTWKVYDSNGSHVGDAELTEGEPEDMRVWREDYTCSCGVYVHPERVKHAFHCPDCPYAPPPERNKA